MTKIMITMPTSGSIKTSCAKSLIELTQALSARRINFAFHSYEFSDIVISRNYLMSLFLAKKNYSHALLLDSDISFKPDIFFKMLDFDEEFTVAPYPQRSINWEKLYLAIECEVSKPRDKRDSIQKLLAKTMRYNISGALEKGQLWHGKERIGFHTVPGAGAGFMLIKRSVPEKMAISGAAISVPGFNHSGYPGADFHDFFSHVRGRNGAIIHGEDTSFCRRWIIGCAGEIWCCNDAKIIHHGMMDYYGDYENVFYQSKVRTN